MQIEILGMGCSKCNSLESDVRKAVAELGLSAEIAKVSDLEAIVARGVMSTPALIVNGRVKFAGRVPTPQQLRQALLEG